MKNYFCRSSLRLLLLLATMLVCPLVQAQQTGDKDFDSGMKFYGATQYDKAAIAFKRSTERNRNNAEAYYQLANSYFQMFRNKDAVKAYQRAIELKPDHYLAYNNLGTAYHRLGEFKQAINAYESAVRIKPDYSLAIFGLGVVYLELKDKDAALEQHKSLAAIDIELADKLYAYITNRKIALAVLNGKALSLPRPSYPSIARAAQASGTVQVWVSIDETGKVVSASAVSGHPLLRAAAVQAANLARFSPTTLEGRPVRVTGIISYNFLAE